METAILSAENNWSFVWSAANNEDVWHVVEKNVPDGYTVVVERRENVFTIINSIPSDEDSPQTGDTSNVYVPILLTCVSGVALAAIAVVSGKRKP